MKMQTKKELAIPQEHLAVYNGIANSKEKYITKNMILAQLNKNSSYKRRLEQVIYQLVVDYQMPIGASSRKESNGFFIIKDKQDLYLAKRDLKARTSSIMKRFEALEKINL